MALYLVISKRYRITLEDGILGDVVVEERSLGKVLNVWQPGG